MAIIDEFFEAISQETIAREVGQKHDRAREAYPLENITINNFEEFMDEIVIFYQYEFSETIGNGAIMDAEMAFSNARRIIENHFSRQGEINPIEAAYRIAITGVQGGFRLLINVIADSLKASQEEQYINYILDRMIGPQDYEMHIILMRQYLNTYQEYIPEDIRIKPPEALAVNYKQIIKMHVEVLDRIRNAVGRY